MHGLSAKRSSPKILSGERKGDKGVGSPGRHNHVETPPPTLGPQMPLSDRQGHQQPSTLQLPRPRWPPMPL
jgi:hypothetical protein